MVRPHHDTLPSYRLATVQNNKTGHISEFSGLCSFSRSQLMRRQTNSNIFLSSTDTYTYSYVLPRRNCDAILKKETTWIFFFLPRRKESIPVLQPSIGISHHLLHHHLFFSPSFLSCLAKSCSFDRTMCRHVNVIP